MASECEPTIVSKVQMDKPSGGGYGFVYTREESIDRHAVWRLLFTS